MRILLLTPFLPDPEAPHGGGSYLGSLAEGLRTRAELGLVHLHHLGEPTAREEHWSWQASADYQGAPKGAAHRLRMLWRWRSRPLLAGKYWHIELPRLLKRARAEFSPDAVMVEMAQMAQYLPYLQGLPTVFTDHEAGQPANKSTGLGPLADRRDDRLWQRYLTHFYPQASQIQAVTQEDADNVSAPPGRPAHARPPSAWCCRRCGRDAAFAPRAPPRWRMACRSSPMSSAAVAAKHQGQLAASASPTRS